MKTQATSPSETPESITISFQEYQDLLSEKHTLLSENQALQNEVKVLNGKLQMIIENYNLSRKNRFGSSSESSAGLQMSLFGSPDIEAKKTVVAETTIDVKPYKRGKKNIIDTLPDNVPVEVVEHRLPEDEQICPQCEGHLHEIGSEVVRRELKMIPAEVVVLEHREVAYACRNCEKHATEVPVIRAKAPNAVVKGGNASPEAVAYILTQKYMMGVPLYRQEADWRRKGIELSRQTMDNWIMLATERWLQLIYGLMKEELMEQSVLMADETTLQVLREPGKTPQSKSFMWLYRTGGAAAIAIVIMEYQPDRTGQRPREFLKGFEGFLHTDGYAGYNNIPNVTRVGCLAHIRRIFMDALIVLPPKDRAGSGAFTGLSYCDKLFAIEREITALAPKDKFEQRLILAKPVLEEFYTWLKAQRPIKNKFGQAINYALGQWKYLENYLLSGELELSNNRSERSIRGLCISRKNFLFANTPRGAECTAIACSILETVKENGIDPYEYLVYIFTEMPNSDRPACEYLPWSDTLPERCYIPKKKNQEKPNEE